MATSIQTVGERAEAFNDLDLIAIVRLLGQEAAARPGEYSAITAVLARWERNLAAYGPGTIDLNFNDLASSDKRRSELILLLAAVDKGVGQFGKTIPSSVLNDRCAVPGVTFQDYPISLLRLAMTRLRGLLG